MIGELLSQKADLAVADLTITYEREQVWFKIFAVNFANVPKQPTNFLPIRMKVDSSKHECFWSVVNLMQ